jgi:hypothetical protein
MNLLALSGSLRAGSFNISALRTLQKLAPEGVEVSLHEGIVGLPHFSPDIDTRAPGTTRYDVACLRRFRLAQGHFPVDRVLFFQPPALRLARLDHHYCPVFLIVSSTGGYIETNTYSDPACGIAHGLCRCTGN